MKMRRAYEEENPLALSTRKNIYGVVEANPGLHFREIQRRLDIATGALQYHLEYLAKFHFVRTERQGKFLRYYSTKTPSLGPNQRLMNALRQPPLRKILLFLLSKRHASVHRIAREVGLSASTISWHMHKLTDEQLVTRTSQKGQTVYAVTDKKSAAEFVKSYRDSFLDRLVDNFVTLWDQSAQTIGNGRVPKSFDYPRNN